MKDIYFCTCSGTGKGTGTTGKGKSKGVDHSTQIVQGAGPPNNLCAWRGIV
jgi:hypothetical protein